RVCPAAPTWLPDWRSGLIYRSPRERSGRIRVSTPEPPRVRVGKSRQGRTGARGPRPKLPRTLLELLEVFRLGDLGNFALPSSLVDLHPQRLDLLLEALL